MSKQFTKDNLNDIVTESIVDSLNYNNKQAVTRARGGIPKPDQTYFERYSNNKSLILKNAGVEESSIPESINIENVLVAKQIHDYIIGNHHLVEFKEYYLNGHFKIDPTGPHTTLKITEEKLLRYNGVETLLNIKPLHNQPIGKGYTVDIPSQYNVAPLRAKGLLQGLMFAEGSVKSAYEHMQQQELNLKQKEPQRLKPKM